MSSFSIFDADAPSVNTDAASPHNTNRTFSGEEKNPAALKYFLSWIEFQDETTFRGDDKKKLDYIFHQLRGEAAAGVLNLAKTMRYEGKSITAEDALKYLIERYGITRLQICLKLMRLTQDDDIKQYTKEFLSIYKLWPNQLKLDETVLISCYVNGLSPYYLKAFDLIQHRDYTFEEIVEHLTLVPTNNQKKNKKGNGKIGEAY